MAEPDVGADAPLSPQLFDGGVHVEGVPGDDSVRDEVQAEDLVGLLISLTALDLALVSEEQEAPECVEGLRKASCTEQGSGPSGAGCNGRSRHACQ